MKNSATTGINNTNAKDSYKTKTKKTILNLKTKIANVLSTLLFQIVTTVVVALFSLVIKIEPFKCLSGFCYDNNSKAL